MESKTLKIEIPEGYEIDREKSTFETIVFKPIEKSLPKTWEEFCKTHGVTEKEAYINNVSQIIIQEVGRNFRNRNEDRSFLPDRETAEAMLALCQLIQLRDCYNDGWRPDLLNSNELKFMLYFYDGECTPGLTRHVSYVLVFKTRELRDAFYDNFKDLIEKARLLL